MSELSAETAYRAGPGDADVVGRLLHDFNVEFETPTPEDIDAQRFYERHGFSGRDPDSGTRAFYYALDL